MVIVDSQRGQAIEDAARKNSSHPERVRPGRFLEPKLQSWRQNAEYYIGGRKALRAAVDMLERNAMHGFTTEQNAVLLFRYGYYAHGATFAGFDLSDTAIVNRLMKEVSVPSERSIRFENMVNLQLTVLDKTAPTRSNVAKYPLVDEMTYWVYEQYIKGTANTALELIPRIPRELLSAAEQSLRESGDKDIHAVLFNRVNANIGKLRRWGVIEDTFRQSVRRQRQKSLLDAVLVNNPVFAEEDGRLTRSDLVDIRRAASGKVREQIDQYRERKSGRRRTLTRLEMVAFERKLKRVIKSEETPVGGWTTQAGLQRLREILNRPDLDDDYLGNLLRRKSAQLGLSRK